jgi:transposase
MKRVEVLQEIRTMRFEEIYHQRTEKKLTIEDAAQLLCVSERTFRRYVTRYEEQGAIGLADKRLGKAAHNVVPVDEAIELLTLFETQYSNFTVAHFYDKYQAELKGTRCYTWVKNCLQEAGFVKKAKKRGQHRRKRPRKPMKGMMLHQDGSTHEWVEAKYWDLIVTLDDADNEIYSAFFVEEEGTWSSFQGIKDVILTHGLCCSLYVDRGSHYFYTPNQGGKVDTRHATQFARAMNQLGIELIPAYSPEARGRSERMFGTLQGRLPKELKCAGITELEQANQFLKEQFIPAFNKRFKRTPEQQELAFIPWLNTNMNVEDILCIHEQRVVNKDNTVSYQNKKLQISQNKYRWSYHKTVVNVHEYSDGSIGLFYGPRCIGKYDSKGNELIYQEVTQKQINL